MQSDGEQRADARPGGSVERIADAGPRLRVRDVRCGSPCAGMPSVLLIGADRRFRDVVALLLERRGCSVRTTASIGALTDLIERERPDVAVIDVSGSPAWATRAAVTVAALEPALGIVMVDESEPGAAVSHLSKWGSFQLLFDAVERAAQRPSVGTAV
jgi:DNA-binding NtrC family response regulator